MVIGASLISLGQVRADEVKLEKTAVNSPENVVSDSNLETSASLITRTEVAPVSTAVENTSSETATTDRGAEVSSETSDTQLLLRNHFLKVESSLLMTKATGIT